MKILFCLSALLLSVTSSAFANDKYLVTRQDPSYLRKLDSHIAQRGWSGRALWVELNKPKRKLSKWLQRNLEPIALSELRSYTPVRRALNPDPVIKQMVEAVSAASLKNTVLQLVKAKDRSAGTPENQAATSWVSDSLKTFGYETSLHCYRSDQCSVIAKRSPAATTSASGAVVIMAHLDSVGAAYAGADDNASGVAGALELARLMSVHEWKSEVQIWIFNGEEDGLLGSEAYAKAISSSELKRIKYALNLDMIAYNSNGIVDIETDRIFESDAQWLSDRVRAYSKLTPRITMPAWGSDHVPFLRKKVPTFLTIEHWDTHTPCYHRTCDVESSLNYEYAAEMMKFDFAALIEKAELAEKGTER